MSKRRQVSRVIFGPQWLVITLYGHTQNVTRLAEVWDNEGAYLSPRERNLTETHDKLRRAAYIHDMGKPTRFGLWYRGRPFHSEVMGWDYTFAYHYLEVFDDDPYVQTLARLHHTYSIDDIVRTIARLQDYGVPHAANLPFDLYALQMCDQIEATLAQALLRGTDERQVMLDFHIEASDSHHFRLDPFPFSVGEMVLPIEYAVLSPPPEWIRQVAEYNGRKRRQQLEALRGWVIEALQRAPLQREEVGVCALV